MEHSRDEILSQSDHRLSLALAALSNITWMIAHAAIVHQQLRFAMKTPDGTSGKYDDDGPDLTAGLEQAMDAWSVRLNEIQQDIGDYLSNCDMVSDLDVRITAPGFALWEAVTDAD